MKKIITSILASSVLLISCNNNDDNSSIKLSENKTITFENSTIVKDFVQSGTFSGVSTPVISPGESVTFSFSAANKQFLHFVTMYGLSKDWFFSPKDTGLKLFDDDGKPITGDVSDQIYLWDNGSKNNTTGDPENELIKQVPNITASSLMKLNLEFDENKSVFTLTITNTSGGTANETPFSPGSWAVSNFNEMELINKKPFFIENEYTNDEIKDVAEKGDPSKLNEKLNKNTGIITNVSKVIAVVYEGNENPIYKINTLDKNTGLKELSQRGETNKLENYLKSLNNVKNVYITNAGIAPTQSQSLNIELKENQKLDFVAMFAYSNDWFFSSKNPITTSLKGNYKDLGIYDSGTGVNQYPGAGNNQALFGGTPKKESINIQEVDKEKYSLLKSADNYLKVSIK